VYARAVSPGTTLGRYRTVASQVPVCVGGVMVHPGDIVVGDVDGVVIVPHAQAEAVLKMAQEIDERELEKAKLKAQMLLQVHDELIFEVPESEIDRTIPLVKHVMEKAPEPAVALHVPLQVEARAADNWDEAH
jgi:hypothetical protein